MDNVTTRIFKLCSHRSWHRIVVRNITTSELISLMAWLEDNAGKRWSYRIPKNGQAVFFIENAATALKFQLKHGF